MIRKQYLLGIDIGTSICLAACFDITMRTAPFDTKISRKCHAYMPIFMEFLKMGM